MNKIIQSCLLSFCKEIAQGTLDNKETSVQFEHFINYLIIKREFLDVFDYERFYVGGSGDCGIDGIAIIANDEILDDEKEIDEYLGSRTLDIDFVFIQSKTSENFYNKDLINF